MFWIKLKVLDILLMIRFPNLFRINGVEPTFTFRSCWGLQLPTTEILHYLMMLFVFFDIFGGIFHRKTQTSIFRFAHDLILHAAPYLNDEIFMGVFELTFIHLRILGKASRSQPFTCFESLNFCKEKKKYYWNRIEFDEYLIIIIFSKERECFSRRWNYGKWK